MESIRKKAGYLEGLLSAMKLDENDPDTQLKRGIVSLLSDLAERVEAADDMLGELNDYVESIDDDLSELEGMHDDDGDDEDDFDFGAFDGYEEEEPLRLIKNDAAAPKKVMLPVRCPDCAAVFLISGAPSGKYICPVCGKKAAPQRLTEKNTPIGKSAED